MRAISSTSQRAITPAPGGKPGQARAGIVRMLPPGAGVIGLRQVDEMALRLPQWRAERTAHPRPPLTVCVFTASQPRRIAALSPQDVNGCPGRIAADTDTSGQLRSLLQDEDVPSCQVSTDVAE